MADSITVHIRRRIGASVVEYDVELPQHAGCAGNVGFAWLIEWQSVFDHDASFDESERRLIAHHKAVADERKKR